MITSELCDSNNKMLKISPIEIDFGYVKEGEKVQQIIEVRNDDNVTSRIQVERTINFECFKVENFLGGKITPGEFKKIKIVLDADKRYVNQEFKETFLIRTKTFIYKIPVKAHILGHNEWFHKDLEIKEKEGRSIFNQLNKQYKQEVVY